MDYLTKWSEAYAIPDQATEVLATKIVEKFICRFGIPEKLHSNQGRTIVMKETKCSFMIQSAEELHTEVTAKRWIGPFTVQQKHSGAVYLIKGE